MKISILLPYKENYSKNYAGAVSIFINGINNNSKYKNNTKIFGNTNYKNLLSKNYINIPFKKNIFQSSSKTYVKNFIKLENKRKSEIIEIHNRPNYLKYFKIIKNRKIIFYFHNDPLTMNGSRTKEERIFILNFCDKIIFNSEWTRKRFFQDLNKFYLNSEKNCVIYQSTSKVKVNLKKKEKIISFVGKLNKSKGYDIFGEAIIKILDKFKDWKAYVYGDEPREKILFKHERLINCGYQTNSNVLKLFKKSSIAVTCSRWEEPFGRSSLEASSRGCAVIISNRGGLPETITDGIILKKLSANELYNEIKNLILNPHKIENLQKNSLKNFYLENKVISKDLDKIRLNLFKKNNTNIKKYKILHVTNFNQRHNGRLFYNTGRRINNGFLKLNHTVQTFSDRDTVSADRKIFDITGTSSLNNKLLEIVGNFKPDLIVLGHTDQIQNKTLSLIKNFYPNIKLSQWFLDKMDDFEWKNNKKRFMNKFDLMDINFCTTHPSSIMSFKNKNVKFIPNPVDETFENLKIYKRKFYNFDLFFAISHGVHRGTLKEGKLDKRELFIKDLLKKNNTFKYNFFGINKNQPVWAEEFKNELSKCKMALNLSQGTPMKFYSSDRISQLIGNGILTFIDKKTLLNKLFKNDEVIFYNNINDLSKKINFYKNNKILRNKISKKGMLKYHKYMNSKLIASYIVNKTMNINKRQKFFWENK